MEGETKRPADLIAACRTLASGCLALQRELADCALMSLEADTSRQATPWLGSVGRGVKSILLPPLRQ